jgi:hypothetical protein
MFGGGMELDLAVVDDDSGYISRKGSNYPSQQVSGMFGKVLLFTADVLDARQSGCRRSSEPTCGEERQAYVRDREAQLILCFSRVSSGKIPKAVQSSSKVPYIRVNRGSQSLLALLQVPGQNQARTGVHDVTSCRLIPDPPTMGRSQPHSSHGSRRPAKSQHEYTGKKIKEEKRKKIKEEEERKEKREIKERKREK